MEQGATSGFGAKSTAEEVTQGIDASGLTAIVTGSTAGIGTETARVLALRGAHVYLTGRSVKSALATKEAILKSVPNANLDILAPLDLSSQESVRKCAESFLALDQPLNLLINNAGVVAPYQLTVDGIEINFGTNHIGHFLLTDLLLQKLKGTANKTGIESRIVILASGVVSQTVPKEGIAWDKINENMGGKKGFFSFGIDGFLSYGRSKMANLYHSQELARRLQSEGVTNVTVNAVSPGMIMTSLGRHNKLAIGIMYLTSFWTWKSIPQGAATTCYVAFDPSLKGVSGEYFANCNKKDSKLVHPLADDEQEAKKLWDLSVQTTSA